ncbi:hypothetical protein V5799_023606 [Amblyomma americanum]|uniref:THAP-type domain-containing protein n=1 Tax=Amblyomma americanum TaxID=6943 RepID=A0AAQ4FHH4_AMBAM
MKLSLFGVPKDEELFLKWQRNIPRADKPLERNAAVCELPFDAQFVSRHFEHVFQGQLVRIDRNRPVLSPDGIPTVFPNVPKYLSNPVPNNRKSRERPDPQPSNIRKRHRMDEPSPDSADDASLLDDRPVLAVDSINVPLPSNRWGRHAFGEKPLHVVYSLCLLGTDTSLLHAQKMVVFRDVDSAVKYEVYVRGLELTLALPCDPASVLQTVDSIEVCSGAGLLEEFPLACSNVNLKIWNGGSTTRNAKV